MKTKDFELENQNMVGADPYTTLQFYSDYEDALAHAEKERLVSDTAIIADNEIISVVVLVDNDNDDEVWFFVEISDEDAAVWGMNWANYGSRNDLLESPEYDFIENNWHWIRKNNENVMAHAGVPTS